MPFDAVHYLHRAAPAPILFQLATRDEYIPEAAALVLFELAGEPKKIEWHDTAESARESPLALAGRAAGLRLRVCQRSPSGDLGKQTEMLAVSRSDRTKVPVAAIAWVGGVNDKTGSSRECLE